MSELIAAARDSLTGGNLADAMTAYTIGAVLVMLAAAGYVAWLHNGR